MSEEEKHVWQVGDLCTYKTNTSSLDIFSVVKTYSPYTDGTVALDITVVHRFELHSSTLRDSYVIETTSRHCTFVTLVDLAQMYAKFGLFIADEARRRGA